MGELVRYLCVYRGSVTQFTKLNHIAHLGVMLTNDLAGLGLGLSKKGKMGDSPFPLVWYHLSMVPTLLLL